MRGRERAGRGLTQGRTESKRDEGVKGRREMGLSEIEGEKE